MSASGLQEVVGRNVLGALGRGDHQEPTSFNRTFLTATMTATA
jgi:hypothetical protein